jgi:hypothetical protein
VRGGEGISPLLFKEGWHAKRDGVVMRGAPEVESVAELLIFRAIELHEYIVASGN